MNEVITKVIAGLEQVKTMPISDDEKAEHIKGLMTFVNMIIEGKLNEIIVPD